MTDLSRMFAGNPMSGRHFRAFTNWEAPLTMPNSETIFQRERSGELRYPNATPISEVKGLCIDILVSMARDLNFTYDLYFPPDGKWGAPNPETGEYNGMVRSMIDKHADLIIGAMSINSIRETVIDFATPYLYVSRGMLMRSTQNNVVEYFRFLKPFTLQVWLAILISIVLVGLMVSLVNKLSPYDWSGHCVLSTYSDPKVIANMEKYRKYTYRRYKRESEQCLNWHNAVWYSLAAMFEEGGHGNPESVSGRMVLLTWWFAVLVLITMYTAVVTSWLTKARLAGEIETMADLVNSDYSYGVIQATGTHIALKGHGDTLYRNALKKMEQNKWLQSSETAGLDKACTEKFAFMAPVNSLIAAKIARPECNFRIPKESFSKVGRGIGVPKGQEDVRKVINHYILTLNQKGTLDELLTKWVKFEAAYDHQQTSQNSGQMKAGNMLGIFIIVISSAGVGLVFLVLEKCVAVIRKKSKRERETRTKRDMQGNYSKTRMYEGLQFD